MCDLNRPGRSWPFTTSQRCVEVMASYGEAIMALLRAGFTHREILDLMQTDGREAVLKLGEDALQDEEKAS